ncbi:extracellular calcium-sensing receptor isoform X2 [Hydra vulgaris]|uniref:Extracellular calcium-sensing receptor isoform X2 n=1 Tax=Hydra vulgaris TaxID=6087 RepID=A0ABM4C621_HYDVU
MEFDYVGDVISPEYEYAYAFNNSFLKFGSWKLKKKKASIININNNIINWSNNRIPLAICWYNCPPGTYRVNSTVSVCCWICEVCPQNTVSSGVNQNECTQCSVTSIVNKNKTQCINLKEIRFSIKKPEGLIIAIGSSIGVVCCLFVLGLYVVHWNTPLVKSSNREMSAIQLISIMGLFCLSFLYYLELTSKLCMIRTMVFGFLFTTVIAMVCIKTYRLVRVFNVKFSKLSRFLENKFQIGFSFLLIFLQTFGVLLWYIYFPAFVVIDRYPENKLFFRMCDHEVFWGILIYDSLLAIACGYMAFRSRNLPEKFNDAQHISYAMFTVCIIWLSFLPLYKSLSSHVGQVAFISINLVSSYSSLFILYSKKVIFILFYPNLNNIHSFRNTANKSVLINISRRVKGKDGAMDTSIRSVVMFQSYDDSHEQSELFKCDTRDVNLEEKTFKMSSCVNDDHIKHDKVPLNTMDPLINALEENMPLIHSNRV